MIRKSLIGISAALALGAMQATAQGGGGGSDSGPGTGQAGGATGAGQQGQPTNQTPSQAAKPLGDPTEVSGRVALVSAADHELAIDAGTATTQVKVAPDAQITIDGKRGALKDIRQGTQVRASLERRGDEIQAKKLEVTSTAKKK